MKFRAHETQYIPDSCNERFLPSGKDSVKKRILCGGISRLCKGFFAERPKNRDYHILIFTLEGQGIFEFENGASFTSKKEDLVYSPASGIGHRHIPATEYWDLMWLRFDRAAAWLINTEFQHRRSRYIYQIYHCVENIIKESIVHELRTDRLLEIYSEMLDLYLHREFSQALNPNLEDIRFRMNQVWDSVNANLSKQWPTEKLAEMMGMSRTLFFKHCRELFGMTPGEKIRALRMKRAEQLLVNFQSPVYLIAQAVGYENPNSFISVFSAYFGQSPLQYRKSRQI